MNDQTNGRQPEYEQPPEKDGGTRQPAPASGTEQAKTTAEAVKAERAPSGGPCPLLDCRRLTKRYDARGNALENINLSIYGGRIVGLLGPNGSGKTTFIKLVCGLLEPTEGELYVSGFAPGVESKLAVSYLPDRIYLNNWMRVRELIRFYEDFYSNFNSDKAYSMLRHLNISPEDKLKTMSKGTKEKVQLILTMSREASLYLLDEPIGGVDPAARDYILNTILTNYNPGATVIISTHLISDVERILDDVIFISRGQIMLAGAADDIRAKNGKSIDDLFREVFRC